MKSEMLGMIDDQYKSSYIKQLEEEILLLRKEITRLEELIENKDTKHTLPVEWVEENL